MYWAIISLDGCLENAAGNAAEAIGIGMVDMKKEAGIIHFDDVFKKKCAIGNAKFCRSIRNRTFKMGSFRPSYSCIFQNKSGKNSKQD